jgi:1-acyl-sn-glycerol-3-phosphate acyltransferase
MRLLQAIFFLLVVRPLIQVIIGLNVHGEEKLPFQGPAIIAANHNSHLDTLTLLSLWPLPKLHQVRPAAAADYFLSSRAMAWFSLNIIGIVPIDRTRQHQESDPLADMSAILKQGQILLLFPEGSRGTPEELSEFKSGVSRLAELYPDVPIVPVFMYGLGKSLPRGDFLLVPFFADVLVGDWLYWQGSVEATQQAYQAAMDSLAKQIEKPPWE